MPRVNERFHAARAEEARNRLRSVFPITTLIVGSPVGHLTLRIEAELLMSNNALICGAAPLLGDVFNFLWRLHPLFARPRLLWPLRVSRPGLRLWLWRHIAAYGFARGFARWSLMRRIAKCDLVKVEAEIQQYLKLCYQDQPGAEVPGKGQRVSEVAHRRTRIDSSITLFGPAFNLTPAEVLDEPIAQLFQLLRDRLLADGNDIEVFAPSDALFGK